MHYSHNYSNRSEGTFSDVVAHKMGLSLTHCRLNELTHTIYWKSPISNLGSQAMSFRYSQRKMAKLFANSGDPDQTPHSAASDLGLHCLPITLLGVFQRQWVKQLKQQ